jgi:NAD-dependent dihydropyrimidine dehydrogenase PreA subunit
MFESCCSYYAALFDTSLSRPKDSEKVGYAVLTEAKADFSVFHCDRVFLRSTENAQFIGIEASSCSLCGTCSG